MMARVRWPGHVWDGRAARVEVVDGDRVGVSVFGDGPYYLMLPARRLEAP